MTPPPATPGAATADGDDTRRIKTMLAAELAEARTEAEGHTLVVKKLRFWAVVAVSVAGAGFAAAMFLFGNFAKSETAADHEKRIGAVEQNQAIDHKQLMDQAVEIRDTHEDVRWIMRQAASTARAVRAPVEPNPEHEKTH